MKTLDDHLKELEPVLADVVVVYIIDRKNNRVIFGERKKKDKPGFGARVGIGGKIEERDGTLLQTTFRETIEEIGTKLGGKDKTVYFELKSAKEVAVVYFLFPHKKDIPGSSMRCYVFVSDDYVGNPVESDEIKPEWYPIDQLPEEFMWPDNLLWVPKVLAGDSINGIFLYAENGKLADYRIEQ